MNTLPVELQNIITDYKCQIKQHQKYNKCITEINEMTYETKIDNTHNYCSERGFDGMIVKYTTFGAELEATLIEDDGDRTTTRLLILGCGIYVYSDYQE